MTYRIAGFSDQGEARIVDDENRLIAYGELRLEAFTSPDRGDVYDLDIKVTWAKDEEYETESLYVS